MSGNRASDYETRLSELVGVMARLRSPEGCPWDRQQDHRSLRPCLLEEAYEVLEAIDREDFDALREELGDLLLQVVFHAQLAAEEGRFTMADVIGRLHDKLVARHPHVFGSASADTPAAVLEQWDHLKRTEGGAPKDRTSGPPSALPALARAQVLLRRAARAVGARSPAEARASVEAALSALPDGAPGVETAEAAIGEILLAVVDLAGACGVDAEQALRERLSRRAAQPRETSSEPAPPADSSPGAAHRE